MQYGFIGGAQVIQRQPGGYQLLNRADKLMYVLFNCVYCFIMSY